MSSDTPAKMPGDIALQSTQDAHDAATQDAPQTMESGTTTLAHARLVLEPKQYIVTREHARGGLGRILVATDTQLDRPVAIKLLLHASRQDQRRFMREALITARLQHPAIVPIYDAGKWTDGEPFYAMRLVAGEPLARRIRATSTLADRLALLPNVIVVAEAMAYAHSRGFIHRDLKPDNVLIGEFGETVVIDWGLAKYVGATDDDDGGAAEIEELARLDAEDARTLPGKIMGTPAFMPPEQARGHAVDPRADVYAIGAILYQVLSGKLPYASSGLRAMELLKHAAVSSPEPLEVLEPAAPRDLLAIVSKAMARDANDRYPSGREVAEDLRRFQTGQLVAARRYTRWQLVTRWLSRNSTAVAFATIGLATIGAVGGVSVARIVAERDRADGERAQARAAQADAIARADELTLLEARTALDRDPTATIASLKNLSPAWTRWDDVRSIALDAKLRGVAEKYFAHGAEVWATAYSPDGKKLAIGGTERSLRIVDVATGASRALAGHEADVVAVAFSPSGDELASASLDGTVRLWTLATGESRTIVTHEKMALAVAFSPDGALVASSGGKAGLKIWHRDGAIDVVANDLAVRGSLIGVAFSPDGRSLAYVGEDRRVFIRDLAAATTRTLEEPASLRAARAKNDAHPDDVIPSVAFSSDGTKLVTTSDDPGIRVWDVASGAVRILRGHTAKTFSALFSRDGRQVISAGQDKTIRVWDLAFGTSRVLIGHDVVNALAVSPDGERFVSGSGDRTVRVWRFDSGEQTLAQTTYSRTLAFSPDGTRFATAANDDVLLFDLPKHAVTALHGHTGKIISVAFDKTGERIASSCGDHTARVWRVADGESTAIFTHPMTVYGAALTPDGKSLVTACEDGLIRVFDLGAPDAAPQIVAGHKGPVYGVVVSSDGKHAASASWDKTVRIWDTATWKEERALDTQGDWVIAVSFSPDGARVASGGYDHTVRVWDVATGAGRVLGTHDSWVTSASFSPDGTHVLSAGFDRRVRDWDLATGLEAWSRTLPDVVHMAAFSPDGARVATTGEANAVTLWSTEMPFGAALRDWIAHATNAVMTAKGDLSEPR